MNKEDDAIMKHHFDTELEETPCHCRRCKVARNDSWTWGVIMGAAMVFGLIIASFTAGCSADGQENTPMGAGPALAGAWRQAPGSNIDSCPSSVVMIERLELSADGTFAARDADGQALAYGQWSEHQLGSAEENDLTTAAWVETSLGLSATLTSSNLMHAGGWVTVTLWGGGRCSYLLLLDRVQ